ncbi:MAG: hypothetical protein ACJA0N_000621 [Pseudohongiellaceae bacterium]|jgi:hypothetical protein
MNAKIHKSTSKIRCFPRPETIVPVNDHWFNQWQKQFNTEPLEIGSVTEEALARLLPTLICGEQSAVFVFANERDRLSTSAINESFKDLANIESDEAMHEKALQQLASRLMQPKDLHQIKRRAQRFYSGLNKQISIAQHFATICQLDACVGKIMNAMSQSNLGPDNPISILFEQIKKDEARHVVISRKHALRLGASRDDIAILKLVIGPKVIELLSPMQESFEALGVDFDRLIKTLRGSEQ